MKIIRPNFFEIHQLKNKITPHERVDTNPDSQSNNLDEAKTFLDDIINDLDIALGSLVDEIFVNRPTTGSYEARNVSDNANQYIFDDEEKKIPDEILYDDSLNNNAVKTNFGQISFLPDSVDIFTAYKHPEFLLNEIKYKKDSTLMDFVKENINGKTLVEIIPLLNKFYSPKVVQRFPKGKISMIQTFDENIPMICINVTEEELSNRTALPVACVVFRDEENKISLFIPYFGNSFKIMGDKMVQYSLSQETDVFDENGLFNYFNIDLIRLNSYYSLVDVTKFKPKIDIREYGVFKTKGYNIEDDHSISIGTFTFNGKQNTRMFKKDHNIPVSTKSIDIYIKTKGIKNKHFVAVLADIFGASIACYLSNNSDQVPSFLKDTIEYKNGKLHLSIDYTRAQLKPLFDWSKLV